MPNRLASEKSPYLLQHKDNPVNWFPWGAEAVETARRENRPILLSVGYSTCYWCHVMEHDSFETDEVAEVLNEHFISIKVDREERPDVDKLYMDAVVGFSGRGGWPMSVFLTPDLKPFFGATFFWRAQFISLLEQVAQYWRTDRAAITESADEVMRLLQHEEERRREVPKEQLLVSAFHQLHHTFDPQFAGFGPAPKFPPAEKIRLLLRIHRRSGHARSLTPAVETLSRMMRGGLFDQVGGGFHRYSTDDRWLVPHFEKMLYDNALLPVAYLEAFQAVGDENFARTARLTLDYIIEVLTGPQGEIYSAEDAGEVGKEGEFYLWTNAELRSVLSPDEAASLAEVFDLKDEGNFEGRIVLAYRPDAPFEVRERPLVQAALTKLKTLRSRRERPRLDDKALTAWMSLAVSALCKGHAVLREQRYLDAAGRCVSFIRSTMMHDGELMRRYRDNNSAIPGYLDDYSFFIQALIDLYQLNANDSLLELAEELQTKQDLLFWDAADAGYFYSRQGDPHIIVRKKEFQDGAEPSGNAVSALNLLRLCAITGKQDYYTRAEKLFASVTESIDRYPSGFAGLLIALDFYLDRAKEVAVIGDQESQDTHAVRDMLLQSFIPNLVYSCADIERSKREDVPALIRGKKSSAAGVTVYVCERGVCTEPLSDPARICAALNDFRPLTLNLPP